jgi:hypothetical protein
MKIQNAVAVCKYGFGRKLTLTATEIINNKGETHPLAGVQAEFVSTGKLKDRGQVQITGPDFIWTADTDHKHNGGARKFVLAVNLAVRQLGGTS